MLGSIALTIAEKLAFVSIRGDVAGRIAPDDCLTWHCQVRSGCTRSGLWQTARHEYALHGSGSVPMEPPLFSIRPKYRTFCETLVVILFCRAGRRFAVDRRLTVILAADVLISRLMEVDEERTHAAFSTCHTAIAGLVAKHRGRILPAPATACWLSSRSCRGCAGRDRIRNDLAERRLDLAEGHQMKFRIGINLGDVIVDGSNLYGAGVNVAVV